MDWDLLCGSPLTRGLSGGAIQDLFTSVPYRTKKYRQGSLVAQSGEEVLSMNIVVKGTVKGEMVDYAGRVIKIEDIPSPGALAPAFIFGRSNMYPVNVVAITETEILSIEKPDFLKLLMSDSRLLANFLDMISSRSQFLSEKIKFLNFKTIRGKLAQYILNLPLEGSNRARLDRTQSDLADFFGVARPSIARALGELEQQGIIRAEGKSIEITDRKRLSDLINE